MQIFFGVPSEGKCNLYTSKTEFCVQFYHQVFKSKLLERERERGVFMNVDFFEYQVFVLNVKGFTGVTFS